MDIEKLILKNNAIINFDNNKSHRLIGISPIEAPLIKDIEIINKINLIKEREFQK